MPIQIVMPTLSPTMDKGKLAKWRVKEGQQVKAGDVICEVETDKATIEVEAVDTGKVAKLLVAEGTADVKVNTPIAYLEGEGASSRVAGALTQRVGLVRPLSGANSATGTPQPHPDVVPTARREAQSSGGAAPAGTVIGRARLKGDHGQPQAGGGQGTVAPTVGIGLGQGGPGKDPLHPGRGSRGQPGRRLGGGGAGARPRRLSPDLCGHELGRPRPQPAHQPEFRR